MSKKNTADTLTDKELDKVSGGTEIADNEILKINHDNFDTSIKFNNVDFDTKITINNSALDTKINFNNFETNINLNNFDTSIKINNKSDIKTLKND